MMNSMRSVLLSVWLILLFRLAALGLGPHEVVLVVNADSEDSRRIAALYQKLRSIPEQNVVKIKTGWLESPGDISAVDFRKKIMIPVKTVVRERGLAGHVLAWVYAPDFPTRIKTTPPMSLQGITLMRGVVPRQALIKGGLYASALFSGPNSSRGVSHFSQTLDVSREFLGSEMPLPNMMLGYTGQRGNTVEEVESCLRRGVAADGTAPTGTVFFVALDDVRSRCRQWQYHPAAKELSRHGVASEIKHSYPAKGRALLGMSVGTPSLKPDALGPYLPGAMAEHLTSFGAVFESAAQTKLTEWIRAGATASCGTVTEPLSLWMKFPNARFYAHYAAGCSMLESFYQSVRCPLQLLIVGDPLCRPWPASDVTVTLRGIPAKPVNGRVRLEAMVEGRGSEWFIAREYFVDGRKVGEEDILWLNTETMSPGRHSVRAVVKTLGFVKHQCFVTGTVTVAEKGGKR